MLKKSEGIVLRTLKHQDAHLITRMYTETYGMQDFIIKGYASAASRRKYSYFQPLSIIEVVYFEKHGQEIHKVQESRMSVFLKSIQTNPIKVTLGLSISEIFYDCVKEQEGDEELYQLLKTVIVHLDESEEKFIHYFFYFLVHFLKVSGFAPDIMIESWDKPAFFDFQNGRIFHHEGGNSRLCFLFTAFLQSDIENCTRILFSNEEKKMFISGVFQYYHFHVQGFRQPKTIQVFSEIFEG